MSIWTEVTTEGRGYGIGQAEQIDGVFHFGLATEVDEARCLF